MIPDAVRRVSDMHERCGKCRRRFIVTPEGMMSLGGGHMERNKGGGCKDRIQRDRDRVQ
jgi:hypothetical protein